ncbi:MULTISPECIES: TerC family protein [Allobacillus]|uniref:TerC family protein n=1 Tax=Allobacillus salarius TaxID=1955272 RepID=A0A556PM89_9BACI|nr:TerC family protein [Allobacillus salarius]TSJ65514.1 TerC family protein [Allobacillus salarius]
MDIFFTELFTNLNWDIFKAVLIIIGLDLILGGDNAVVIAMASRNLPEHLQNKAIALGTVLAVFIRFLLACVAIYLLTIPYLQLIGGLFLLYIAFSLLKEGEDDQEIQASGTLLGAVKTIVIADVVMGFDNVLAISAASNQDFRLILFGLAVSVPIIVFGSRVILYAMKKYPLIIYFGASLLAYTSGELILNEQKLEVYIESLPYIQVGLPILLIVLICLYGRSKNIPVKA